MCSPSKFLFCFPALAPPSLSPPSLAKNDETNMTIASSPKLYTLLCPVRLPTAPTQLEHHCLDQNQRLSKSLFYRLLNPQQLADDLPLSLANRACSKKQISHLLTPRPKRLTLPICSPTKMASGYSFLMALAAPTAQSLGAAGLTSPSLAPPLPLLLLFPRTTER